LAADKKPDLPPMLQQYRGFKKEYPDCLLLFQVGDFYEVFFEDATVAARALNITLTTRDKNSPDPIPMCGVPIAVVDTYSERLVNQGYSVALVSQVGEVPAKGMVKRELDRIITPGVRLLGSPESPHTGTTVVAVYPQGEGGVSLAFSDVQSGLIFVREGLGTDDLTSEISRIEPKEIILPKEVEGKCLDKRVPWIRRLEQASQAVVKFRLDYLSRTGVSGSRSLSSVPGYSSLEPGSKRGASLLVSYIDEVTVSRSVTFSAIRVEQHDNVLVMDATTRRNLELVKNSRDGTGRGTLYEFMNRTATAGAARLLRKRILKPSIEENIIKERLSVVEHFVSNRESRKILTKLFKTITDIERVAARIELEIALPKELAALRDALQKIPQIRNAAKQEISGASELSMSYLKSLETRLEVPPTLMTILCDALLDEPAAGFKEGGIIREGYNDELDRMKLAATRGRQWILDLEASERIRIGAPNLKIKYNSVLNYFFELTKANAGKAPEDFIKRQSTTAAERYTSTRLNELSEEVLSSGSRQIVMEKTLYEEMRKSLIPFVKELRALGYELSNLDLFLSLSELAEKENLVYPLVDSSCRLHIKNGRHPILEKMLKEEFIPNSTDIEAGKNSCHIVTGPNMGGKSTFLRQTGLICIMAQLGSFIPASSAHLGLVDKIFARIGASDDILEGDSTFMVEMKEAAHIITNASSRSLLLIDELGRGTATADGLAISRAVLEWIVNQLASRTIFATHFHELTTLEDEYPAIKNFSVGSLETPEGLVFTHEICPGAASSSYGIEVARRAGLPVELLQRAEQLVSQGRSEEKAFSEQSGRKREHNVAQLALFTNQSAKNLDYPEDYNDLKKIKKSLDNFNVSQSTPLEALQMINSLKETLKPKVKKIVES